SPTRPRRSRVPLVLGVVGVLLAGGAFGGLQVASNLSYDDSAALFDASGDAVSAALTEAGQKSEAVTIATTAATQISNGDSSGLVPAESAATLSAATTAASTLVTDLAPELEEAVPAADPKPGWFWELFGEAEALSAQATELDARAAELEASSADLVDAGAALDDAAIAALSGAAESAAGFESAHISAKTLDVIALRDAASALASVSTLDDDAVSEFATLQSAAAQVVASEQTELAEKAGPLLQTRLEIEAFARSLAPGVLLEFDWSPIVNGYGGSTGMGGLTTWWWDQGRAAIELSNSVAEQWPAESSRALVAHEVGHAISVKCEGMYDASTSESIESWATAWAISMGFTDDGNGVWAYGYPPQSYIDAAYGCR
ncbi:hypothetical protein ACI3KS_04830, partial [Microbacterium sp. ZW T5_45]|uniref:hypothetical protein n=1 Tax=Microbacterium sp. ZW T5_45 TaxID=3378080 RepID=UPI003852BC10